MNFSQADNILHKYNLAEIAEDDFKYKTRKDTGKIDLGLRLRICADYLDQKARELRERRTEITEKNPEKCPNYEEELNRNGFAHDDCAFINMAIPKDFCLNCQYYLENIKELDLSIKELNEAAKCYREKANYDDVWQ